MTSNTPDLLEKIRANEPCGSPVWMNAMLVHVCTLNKEHDGKHTDERWQALGIPVFSWEDESNTH